MEQTIIDDVMAEISVTEQITMTKPVNISRCKSEPVILDTQISQTRSEPILKDVIEAVDAEGLLEQFEEGIRFDLEFLLGLIETDCIGIFCILSILCI